MSNKTKKTKAKRMGVKSVLAYGNGQIAITGFGKGNDARVAIQTDKTGSNLAQKDQERHITAHKIVSQGIHTTGTITDKDGIYLHNPAEAEESGQDYLSLKATLEKEFFDKEFPNDNIRIQIIHNILDIQKLLGIYVNDVIYCINNLRDEEAIVGKMSDVVGMGSATIEAGLKQMIPYFGFFGDAFVIPPKTSIDKKTAKRIGRLQEVERKVNDRGTAQVQRLNLQLELDELKQEFPDARKLPSLLKEYEQFKKVNDQNLAVLSVLSKTRQITAHYEESHKLFLSGLAEKFDTDWRVVEKHFEQLVNRINKDFCKHSALNVKIIADLLKVSEDNIVPVYYCFAILKEGKNLGVNMKHLREVMLAQFLPELTDPETKKQYDSHRSKIYGLTDFILFKTLSRFDAEKKVYVLNDEICAHVDKKWVDLLRETEAEAKDELYAEFAQIAWNKVGEQVKSVIENIQSYFKKKDAEKTKTEEPALSHALIADVSKKLLNFTSFAKLLAFLCNFWEGKEINELLSAYIHKFENIQAFIDILAKPELEGEKPQFTEKYALFNEANGERAGEIAKNLRVLASIGKMKPDLSGAKRKLYQAAITMLGISDDSEFVSDEWLEKCVLLNKSKYVIGKDKKNKPIYSEEYHKLAAEVNPFRNFIAGQVIESRRFMYLVRYTKPKTVRALMNNKTVVQFVLQRIANIKSDHITESQIDRYYQCLPSYRENVKVDLATKITALTDYLVKYSFEERVLQQKEGIVFNSRNPPVKKIEIEHLKALTGLYLSVAYIAVKNLVKANARYYIAFSIFERDYALFKQKLGLSENDWKFGNFTNPFAITEHFLDEDENVNREKPFVMQPNGEKFGKQFRAYLKTVKHHFGKREREYLHKNIDEAKAIQDTGWLLTAARNDAEHLNVLTRLPDFIGGFKGDTKNTGKPRNLYFQLYHYLVQCLLFEDGDLHDSLLEYEKKVKQFGTPSSDLINITYVSLGYNLPRYKNLTIEGLFEEQQ